MEKDWIEYQCKSGQTMFLYNKVTGEHKLPYGLGPEIQGKIIYGQPVTYKEFCTIATQTDDNGCNNGCMSMYINTDLSCVSSTSNAMQSQQNSGVSDEGNSLNNVPFSPREIFIKQELSEDQCSTMATVLEEVVIENNLLQVGDNDSIIYENEHSEYFLVDADNQVYEKNSNSTNIISGADNEYNNHDGSQIDAGNGHCCNDNFADDLSQVGCSNVDDCGENSECVTDVDNETKVAAQAQEKAQHNKKCECLRCKKKILKNSTEERHRIQSNMQSFECSYCQKIFTKKDHLRRHTKIHTSEKQYKCSVCMKGFIKHSNMKRHHKTHIGEKPFECDVCKKRFTRKSDMLRHTSIHTGVKPFECAVCKKSFTQKGSLSLHLRIHTGFKPFECTICKKVFSQKCQLLDHAYAHTGVRPYECSICLKRFVCRSNLSKHARLHTGERPYNCAVCNKTFRLKSHLSVHEWIHSGEKPFECTVCKKTFRRKHHMVKHASIHTKSH